MSARANAHRLVDDLPEETVEAVERFLSRLASLDPLERALLLAPLDDEPETAEERASVEDALRDLRDGRTLSHEEFKRGLVSE